MDILWYIVQKMGCFGTLICPWAWVGNSFSRHLGTPKSTIIPLAPNMEGPPGDIISSK